MQQASTDIIRYRIAIAAQLGADITEVLRYVGAPADFMVSGPRYVDLEFERSVWRALIHFTQRHDIGLICGERFPSQAINMLGYVMANAPTIRDAFEKCCLYQRLIGDSMGMEMEMGPHTSTIRVTQKVPWKDEFRYTVDLMMAAWQSWSTANAPAPVRPLRVAFHYQRPADVSAYDSFFAPAPVVFGEKQSAQVFDNSALDQTVIGANRDMFSYFDDKAAKALDAHEGRDKLTYRVRLRILDHMKASTPQVEDVAFDLAMSVRKLQHGLSQEQTKFSDVLQTVRCDLAKEYLEDPKIGNAEIAYLLGYSEVSVFSRSFKKWTGQTPSEYVAGLV